MTYLQRETSTHGASPVELYEFIQGGQTWRYTSRGANVVALGHTWTAVPLRRSDVEQGAEINRGGIDLTFPRSNAFAAQFLGYAADVVTTVTLYRGHTTDPDAEFAVYWKGRVAASKAAAGEVIIECESVFTSLRRPGLRARYQRSCRHALYGAACTLDPAGFAVSGLVTAVSGAVVSVDTAALQASGWYLGGMLRGPGGDLRLVAGHEGALLTLSRPIEGLEIGHAVQIYPGCDRGLATCETKFNNLDNFGGMPWIPVVNPFGGNSIA
jgi:uncharacterized phage protein (TIGR02218 family)